MPASRRRSATVAVGAAALVVASLTGCSSTDYGYTQPAGYDGAAVCVDQKTGKRVDDSECKDPSHYHGSGYPSWYYLHNSQTAPGVGSAVRGGSYTAPSGNYLTGGVPKVGGGAVSGTTAGKSVPGTGGKSGSHVSRGGFGGKSGSVGG